MRALTAHMTFEKVPSKHPEHTRQELMHTLSIRISFLRIKIPNFKRSFQNMQSIHVSDVYTERMRQELTRILSVHAKN
jgi:hypothetical protein